MRGVRWHPDFTDLIPADGGKPRGIQRFMAHYGITREQTMAFGDGGTTRICPGFSAGIESGRQRATAELKAAADYITDDVDHLAYSTPYCISGCYAIKIITTVRFISAPP